MKNPIEKMQDLLLKEKEIQKEKDALYKSTFVIVKPGDIVQSLYKGFCYYVFISPWTGKLSYTNVAPGHESCGCNEIHDGKIEGGILVQHNGYHTVLNRYYKDGVSETVIKSFIKMNSAHENHKCCQRFCHWCGQRITADLVD